jgi:hypothetical protein
MQIFQRLSTVRAKVRKRTARGVCTQRGGAQTTDANDYYYYSVVSYLLECLVKAFDQVFIVKGFAQKAERSGVQYAYADFFIGISSDENYRDVTALRNQVILQVRSAHAGHI